MKNNETKISGIATAPGIAIGPAFIFKPVTMNLTQLNAFIDSPKSEVLLFDDARSKVLERLEFEKNQSKDNYGKEFADIFESQIQFLIDQILIDEIKTTILESKRSAAHAVSKVLSEKTAHFKSLDNKYFRERAFDINDLKQKLLMVLFGVKIDYSLNAPSIIIAENLSPTDTINFNRNLILGFITEEGGETSHAAIFARGLKIPSIVAGNNLRGIINNNDQVILDGFTGKIILKPDDGTLLHYKDLKKAHEKEEAVLFAGNSNEAITTDNKHVHLFSNIEFAHEVKDVLKFNSDGVGLFRTEAMFLESDTLPNEKKQFDTYKKIVQKLKGKPLTIRTIDLGGDKLLDGFTEDHESNPFLGWRAIRLCLDNPHIFKPHLRAILRASAYGNIKILLPMVSSVNEILRVKTLLAEVYNELKSLGFKVAEKIEIGVMVETPAAAVMAPVMGKHVDFMSIGSNDLTQYILAVDRTNSKVSSSYSSFDPAVLRLMNGAVNAAIANDIDVSICGEFAGSPAAIPILLGMGIRSLSVTPHFIPRIKNLIRSLSIRDCIKLYNQVKILADAGEIEKKCHSFIKTNNPEISFQKEGI